MNNVKPCPFCGSKNVHGNIRWGSAGRYFYYISCDICRGQSGTVAAPKWIEDLENGNIWETEEYKEAVTRWNNRNGEDV